MNIILILKGFIVGIGKIIPGISGSMLAIILGVYESIINAITNFFSDLKGNSKLLINFGLGVFLAIVLFSKLILFLLNNYYVEVMYLFLGLIIGTLVHFMKNVKFDKRNILIILAFFLLVMILPFINSSVTYVFLGTIRDYLYIIFLGALDAITSIIPGISGTAIYMLLGSYEFILKVLSNPFSVLFILYSLGVIIGIVGVSYLMAFLFKTFKEETMAGILGLMLSSLVLLFNMIKYAFGGYVFLYMLLGLIIGYLCDK